MKDLLGICFILGVCAAFSYTVITMKKKDENTVQIKKIKIDERGYKSVIFDYQQKEWALDFLTPKQFDSLKNGTLSYLK